MKTKTIRLPDVEAAMLEELKRSNSAYAHLCQALNLIIKTEYEKHPGLGKRY